MNAKAVASTLIVILVSILVIAAICTGNILTVLFGTYLLFTIAAGIMATTCLLALVVVKIYYFFDDYFEK